MADILWKNVGSGNPLTQYQTRLDAANQAVQQTSPYNELWSMMSSNNPNLKLPAGLGANADFIKQQASEHQKALKNLQKEQKVFDAVSTKYNQFTGKETPSSAMAKASGNIASTQEDIFGKISQLGDIFWWEKNDLVDRINQATAQAKQAAAAQTWWALSRASWISTRRWFGTKAMENISQANIANEWLQNQATAESAWIDKISAATSLYNQLLWWLLDKYRETKDTLVLADIQNVVNILNMLKQYKTWWTTSKTTLATPKATAPMTASITSDANKNSIPDYLEAKQWV